MARTPEEAGQLLRAALAETDEIEKAVKRFAQVELGERSTQEYMQRAPIGPRNGASGKLRIQTRRLASSVQGSRYAGQGYEGIMKVKGRRNGLRIEWGSRVPYARVHEKGFFGAVPVQAHTRTITQAFGQEIAPTQVQVQAHTRQMQIPARPYLKPALRDRAKAIGTYIAQKYLQAVRDAIKS